MSIKAVLKLDSGGEMRPRRKAATFPQLTAALREYLSIVAKMRREAGGPKGYRYRSSEELILDTARPVWATFDAMTLPQMQPKECFSNALAVASDNPGFTYTEGFALMDGSIPTHHAWLTGPDGKPDDPTWPAVYRRHADEQPGRRWSGRVVYMGIAVPPGIHRRWIQETGYPNFLAVYDDDVEALLRDGLPALFGEPLKRA